MVWATWPFFCCGKGQWGAVKYLRYKWDTAEDVVFILLPHHKEDLSVTES